MRTSVVLDDSLMNTALKLSGLKTKKKAIEQGLNLLVDVHGQKFGGKLKWSGNPDGMRRGR